MNGSIHNIANGHMYRSPQSYLSQAMEVYTKQLTSTYSTQDSEACHQQKQIKIKQPPPWQTFQALKKRWRVLVSSSRMTRRAGIDEGRLWRDVVGDWQAAQPKKVMAGKGREVIRNTTCEPPLSLQAGSCHTPPHLTSLTALSNLQYKFEHYSLVRSLNSAPPIRVL